MIRLAWFSTPNMEDDLAIPLNHITALHYESSETTIIHTSGGHRFTVEQNLNEVVAVIQMDETF